MRSAIILAGGQSRRFQDGSGQWVDKALAVLSGKPLLVHVIERVKPVVDEIIICVNEASRGEHYLKILKDYSITDVKTCVDMRFSRVQGPFVAIATGLKKAISEYCMVLPCDTPFIKPSVIDYLLRLVEDADICVPTHPNGKIESLMFSCNREKAARNAETLCLLGRSKPIDIIRASSKIKFVSTISELKKLDPDFRSFININFRSDIINLPTRAPEEGPIIRSIDLRLTQPSTRDLEFLGKIAKKYEDEDYLDIADPLLEIISAIEEKGIYFWAGVLWETEGNIFRRLASLDSKLDIKKEYYVKSKVAFEKAAGNFASEAEIYRREQIKFLFECANEDKVWCLNKKDEVTINQTYLQYNK
ncbi:MAG: molybdenum cofactor guanylyltransferase [Candidatus Bathyarchaeia archaeon]